MKTLIQFVQTLQIVPLILILLGIGCFFLAAHCPAAISTALMTTATGIVGAALAMLKQPEKTPDTPEKDQPIPEKENKQ